ncbi:MAG TPA: SGNH/GDSL hydrolase family protein [Candidatus Limnocylindrales bacterium]|nr:SGNH/GDSL hydrolase family protein [Candidatus Limnocylindrales bacterium]
MLKRAASLLCACLLLVIAVPVQTVSAHSSATRADDPIWSGLWAGANFDIGNVFSSPESAASEQAQASNRRTGGYVALGDSVAAGAGLPAGSSPSAEDQRCGRSPAAYPYIVARSLSQPVRHIACSGATAGDLFTVQRSGSPNVQPQLDAAFANGTPELMTITAGANDAEWAGFIRNCYAANCNTDAFSALAAARLTVLDTKLRIAFEQIQARSGSNPPRVIITGYYNPLSQACTRLQSNITSGEIDWISRQVTALNRTIQQAGSSYPFVTFTSVSFTGHDICSKNPWIQGLSSPAAFHPTAEGQRVIARSVIRALNQ